CASFRCSRGLCFIVRGVTARADNPPLERTAAAVYFTCGRASRVRRRDRSTALRYPALADTMKRTLRSLLWWLPALLLAAAAGIMPDTFLDSPDTTIPHEAAFALRLWIIASAFGYAVLVVAIRGAVYLRKRLVSGERRGFPVIAMNAPRQSAG